MSRKNRAYWIDRQEQQFLSGEKLIADYYTDLQKAFRQAQKEIQKVITDYYVRYADANGFSFAAAQKVLDKSEIGELKDFIDLVRANMGKYNLEVTNMSIKARITRYQALQKQIDALLQQLYAVDYELKGAEILKEVYSDSYYRTWFNIDQYKGFHQEFALVDPKSIEKLITYPFNGADYSDRLWKQKDYMLLQLNEGVTTMLVQGKNPNDFSQDFAKKFERRQYEANRLLYTEGTYMIEQGTLAAYQEDDVQQYELVATLDLRTSEICEEMDGKRYNIDEAVTGVNYPPFHPWCRTTTIPYYDDVDYFGSERTARDPITGKVYKVPADMTYKQWKAEYVDNSGGSGIIKSSKKFGQKIGKHAEDYGLNPSKPEDRQKMTDIIDEIFSNYDEKASGRWRGQKGNVDFYIKGDDVVVVNGSEFVTILKGGTDNARVKDARKRKI